MAEDKKAKKDDKPKDDKELKGRATLAADSGKGGDADGAEPAAAEAPPFTPKKLALFVLLPVLLLIGLGTAAYFMGAFSRFFPAKAPDCASVKEGDKDFAACNILPDGKGGASPGAFLDVPNLIVNLNSPSRQPRFLKISLKIELENAEEQKKFEPILPRVVDQFQMFLRELRVEDLRGTAGIYRMKIELLSRVRAAAPDVKVRDVLFQEILVQ